MSITRLAVTMNRSMGFNILYHFDILKHVPFHQKSVWMGWNTLLLDIFSCVECFYQRHALKTPYMMYYLDFVLEIKKKY